eukprot:GSChrysophyteH2.ASY1.ANO1.1651.1 assembled CDS
MRFISHLKRSSTLSTASYIPTAPASISANSDLPYLTQPLQIIPVAQHGNGTLHLNRLSAEVRSIRIEMHFFDEQGEELLKAAKLKLPPLPRESVKNEWNPWPPQNTCRPIKLVPTSLVISPPTLNIASIADATPFVSFDKYSVGKGLLSSTEVCAAQHLDFVLNSLDFMQVTDEDTLPRFHSLELCKLKPKAQSQPTHVHSTGGTSRACIFSSRVYPSPLWCIARADSKSTTTATGTGTCNNATALVTMCTHTLSDLESVEADLDAYNLSCINKALLHLNWKGKRNGKGKEEGNIGPELSPMTESSKASCIPNDPTSVFYLRLKSFNVGFTYELNRIGIVTLSAA